MPVNVKLDHCVIHVSDWDLARHGAEGAGTSVYVRDPDGSLIEFMSYRTGRGRS